MREPLEHPESYALTEGIIFDGEYFLSGYAVCIHKDRIQSLIPAEAIPPGMERVSTEGAAIAPGFVDVQLNGCGGVMFNDAITAEALDIMHAANVKSGCTSFLPTLITTTEDDMRAAMRLVADYQKERGPASVLGLHLEGPYINWKRKGIHNEAHIRHLSPGMRDVLCDYGKTVPLILTLAPECVDADDIRVLSDAGVAVSVGHSDATYAQAKRGIKAGARAATHLFNGMAPWHSREPGIVGAILDSPDLPCGMIVDGRHSHFASIAMAVRLKPSACFLVTDATAPVGTDMTEFNFCGQTVYVRDDMCVNADGTLGGSNLTMIRAVRNCINRVGISPAEALRMASAYPARLMQQDGRIGAVRPGLYANLAIFSPLTCTMLATVDKGKLHIWK